jgi:hypothetical protein
MKQLSIKELTRLVGSSEPSMSVYISLTGEARSDEQKIDQQLQSAVIQARITFPEHSDHFRDVDVSRLMRILCQFDTSSSDAEQPWRGIAYFKSPNIEGYYPSIEISEDLIVLANSFHLKPLFGLIQIDPRYLMIKLDERTAELYQGSSSGITLLRNFSRRQVAHGRPSRVASPLIIDNDDSVGKDSNRLEKKNAFKFFREVEATIRRSVNLDATPAIIVGPDRVIKTFIAANRFRSGFIRTIASERTPIVQDMDYLHQLGLESLVLYNRNRGLKGAFEFKYLRRFGCAVDTVTHVAKAANEGLIKSLLIRRGINLWGKVDGRAAMVNLSKNGVNQAADDILDDIGEMVLARGGEVHVLNAKEMPTQSPVAAVLAASLAS